MINVFEWLVCIATRSIFYLKIYIKPYKHFKHKTTSIYAFILCLHRMSLQWMTVGGMLTFVREQTFSFGLRKTNSSGLIWINGQSWAVFKYIVFKYIYCIYTLYLNTFFNLYLITVFKYFWSVFKFMYLNTFLNTYFPSYSI